MKRAWADRRIWRGSLIISWFWTIGAVLLALLPTLVKNTLGGDESVVVIYLACFSVGIAIGSLLASVIAGGRIILLPTPVAAILMDSSCSTSRFVTIAACLPPQAVTIAACLTTACAIPVRIDFIGVAIAAGLFIVPIFAAVAVMERTGRTRPHHRRDQHHRCGVHGCGAVTVAVLQTAGMATPWIILILAAASLAVGAFAFRFIPGSLLRDFLYLFFRTVYRLEVKGIENITTGGPNPIFACNHVGYGDGPLVMSLIDDSPVFAIDYQMASTWWVRPLLRLTKATPINPANPLATRTLINAVKAGNPLIIFPEGRRTVTGSLMKIYDGAAMVADKSDASVIPVRIDGVEHGRLHPPPRPGAAALPAAGDRHVPRTGQAHRRAGTQGQASPPRRRRRALWDHVRSRLPHDLDRPHHRRGGRSRRHAATALIVS